MLSGCAVCAGRAGRAARAVLAGLALLVAAAGCGQAAGETGQGAAAAAAAPPHRGGTLVTAWGVEPTSVNEYIVTQSAQTMELIEQMFVRLVREEPDFERHPPAFTPFLARSFDWSADHLLLTFHLRENARWSDGVPVTADDVRFTWQAQISPEVAWQYSYMKSEIADVEVVDAHTARFRFRRVYAKQMLDANEGGIVPRHVWGKLPFARWKQSGDWFKQHPVSSGPFLLESWQPQQEVVLRRNPGFFDPSRPHLDRMVMRIIPDQASILTQLDTGEVQFATAISPGDAPRIAANPRLTLMPFWYRTWVGVAWNCRRPPFSEIEVRRALGMALDRPAIVNSIWHGFARVCDSPILPTVWAHDRALLPLPHDPAQALALLAARGFKAGPDGTLERGGKPLAFDILTNAGNQQRIDSLVLIQEQLRRIGVRAQPRVVEFNTLLARLDEGTFDATVVGQTMDTSLDLSAFFSTRAIGQSNQTRYSNPEVDRLLDRAMGRADIAASQGDLNRVQEVLEHDQPYTFLWDSQRLSAFSRRLHGVKPNILYSMYDLLDWWLEPLPQS
jgi:peptide/nickel transport system substrate-binding protein